MVPPADGPALTPWQAVQWDARRFLRSSWPWRSVLYLLTGALMGAVGLWSITLLAAAGVLLTPIVVGLGILVALVLSGGPFAAVERRRLRLVDGRPLRPAQRRTAGWPGIRRWVRTRLREPATWRELGYTVLAATVLWPLDLIVVVAAVLLAGTTLFAPLIVLAAPRAAVPAGAELLEDGWLWLSPVLGVGITIVAAYLVTVAAGMRAALARAILAADKPDLEGQLVEIERSRARLVDGFEAERRRIERDLHDGAQQRLLALSMQLGLLRARLRDGAVPSDLTTLVDSAHEETKRVLDELRELVQGIHPRVLTDRGISAAVIELAALSAVAVDTDLQVTERFPAAVESAVYFTVSEALVNANKHSGAGRVTVTTRFEDGVLILEIRDDGQGDADPAEGTGLQGLADRAATLGGRLLVSSPAGGPTVLRLEIPCAPCAL